MVTYLKNRFQSKQYQCNLPLFVYNNGNHVTKSHLNLVIKSLIKQLGLQPDSYSSHSIRSGAASTAAQSGFTDWEIMRVGGWKSATYRDYIRGLDTHVAGFSARMVSDS